MNLFQFSNDGDAFGFSEGFYDRAVQILSEFIRIPTINPPGDDKPGTRFLEEIFKGHGLAPGIIETYPGREALVCSIPGSQPDLKPLVLAGHIDVVPIGNNRWT